VPRIATDEAAVRRKPVWTMHPLLLNKQGGDNSFFRWPREALMKSLLRIFSALWLFLFSVNVFAADIGVVILHAKGGSPAGKNIRPAIEALEEAGIEVIAPEMPYSRNRGYDADYMEALNEVERAVNQLKANGAKSVFVAGQSQGANTAIGYGAFKGGVDGILATAPGHTVELPQFQKRVEGSPQKAAKMVADGKGNEKDEFTDLNQGKTYTVYTTAAIYHSWFADDGPAVIPNNVRNLKAPLFWAVADQDRMHERGPGYAFAKAPENPLNEYVVVSGRHGRTMVEAKSQMVAWIKKVHASKNKF